MSDVAIREEPKLLKYDAACRAIAECKTVDEAKGWVDKAEAIRAYAKIANNKQLEIDAAEVRVWGERRVGECLMFLRLEGKWGRGILSGQKKGTKKGSGSRGKTREVTVEKLGLKGDVATKCVRLARLPIKDFESKLDVWREDIKKSSKVGIPLRAIADPSHVAANQRNREFIRKVRGKLVLEHNDPFDKYRMIDGRKYGDVLRGEYDRIIKATAIQLAVMSELRGRHADANHGIDTRELIPAQRLAEIIAKAEQECSRAED